MHQQLGGQRDTESWVEGSPLVEVELLVTSAGSGRLLTDAAVIMDVCQAHITQAIL
jgi:hypothetical protein